MEKPFFSIVIPTFNQAKFLKIALNSINKQTFKNFEIIVIDNNSNDSTYKIIKNFKGKINYKKIKNEGLIARSRNEGIKLSKGKWICFLDSDDYWLPNKLDEIEKIIKKKNLDVICHSEHIILESKEKKKIRNYGPFKNNFYETLLKQGNRFSTSASCVKKNFIKKKKIMFEEKKSFITAEDYSFFLHLAHHNANFFFLNDPLGYRLIHSKSASLKVSSHLRAVNSVLNFHTFNIQKFNKNKIELWKEVHNNFLVRANLFYNPEKKNFLNRIYNIIVLFFEFPTNNLNYFFYLLYKKLSYLF